MSLKRLFYATASILMLALAYHLGAGSATAQAPGNTVVSVSVGTFPTYGVAITSNGDVYATDIGTLDRNWTFRQNIFTAGTTPVQRSTLGEVKARYR